MENVQETRSQESRSRGSRSNDQYVTVRRDMLFALAGLAWLGISIAAGTLSGLVQRVGVSGLLSNAFAIAATMVAMYPYLALRADMGAARRQLLPFWQWALASVTITVVTYVIVHPLVVRALP